MKIQLPEFSLALVLLKPATEPSQKDADELRMVTGGYLQQILKFIYPALKGIDLSFPSSQYNANKPEPEYNLYTEVKASVYFDKGTELEGGDIFETVLSSFDRNYAAWALRALSSASPLLSPSATAKVKAGRLSFVPVRTSDICTTFSLPERNIAEPSESDYRELVESTREFYSKQLQAKFNDSFQELQVSVGRAKFEKGAPDNTVSIEWDMAAHAYFIPSEAGTVPGKNWLGLLMIKTDKETYFKEHVLSLKGTLFARTNNFSIEQIGRSEEKKN